MTLKAFRHAAAHAAVLIVLQALWLEPARPQDPAASKLEEEISRQESIYQSRGRSVPRGYTLDRSLSDYERALSSGFDRALAGLGPPDRWLDIGAGEGQAILDYYTPDYDRAQRKFRKQRGGKARTVAMSIEDRRTPLWQERATALEAEQIRYLFGKRLGEYEPGELGKFRLVTDVIGGFSYTQRLAYFLERVLGLLELNGDFYTLLQDVRTEEGKNSPFYEGSPFLTEIKAADGSEMKVCAWLKRVSCVQVTCEAKADWQPPIEAFRVRKVCDDVAVPALENTHYKAGTPPERGFRLRE